MEIFVALVLLGFLCYTLKWFVMESSHFVWTAKSERCQKAKTLGALMIAGQKEGDARKRQEAI